MTHGRTQIARIGKAHRVVLPPRIREVLGVQEGDGIVFSVQDGQVHVQALRAFTSAIQAKYGGLLEDDVDELIAERRAEAERE